MVSGKNQKDYGLQVAVEWHYIDVSDETIFKNIEKRNADILNNKCKEYFTDEGLINKCLNLFEIPDKNEIDVWIDNNQLYSVPKRNCPSRYGATN